MGLFGFDIFEKAKNLLVDALDGNDKEETNKTEAPPAFKPEAKPGDKKEEAGKGNENAFSNLFGGNVPQSLTKCLDVMRLSDGDLEKEAKLLSDWIKDHPAEAAAKPFLGKALLDLEEEVNIRANYDDVTDKPHTQSGLKGTKGEMTRTMIEQSSYKGTPEQWYKEMVSINLFGQTAKGIRPEFAALLKSAEKKTCEKLAKEDPALSNPRLAGKYMGINESYKTSRSFKPEKPEYQSMHLFGLAIDINYTNNPWITQTSSKISPFKKYLGNIDALFNSNVKAGYSYTGAQKEVESTESLETIFDGYDAIDKKVELYFSLLDNDELLQTYLDASTSPKWNKLKLATAKRRIQKDLDGMAAQSSRSGGRKKKFKKEGIMDLDKRLVMSMGEVGLDWGGKYGDMMHFDMRMTGIGKEINKAKRKSKVTKLKKKLKEAKK